MRAAASAHCEQQPPPSDVNPFATRFTRPGAAKFLFPAGSSPQALVLQLAALNWRGQIVGRHGTGKSTLLAALRPYLLTAGRELVALQLHAGQRRLPRTLAPRTWRSETLVVLDGAEQLSWWSRRLLLAQMRRAGCGLLVTTHGNFGLPTLWHSAVTPELACAIVRQLQARAKPLVQPDDVQAALRTQRGNFREALFALYDRYETRRRAGAAEA